MMIVMKLCLILSVSAAAPLNSNAHKESVEENLASDDIGSVDIVKGDDMDGDGLHSHSSQDTGRDPKLVFTGGSVSIGNIGDIHAQVKIASIMSNIDHQDQPAPDPVCPADVAVTEDCMCAGISCATGSTCVGGSTCIPVCPADVAVMNDCMCAGISCDTGSTCVGGSTCTAVCPADVAVTKDCMCAGISCAIGRTCVGGSTCTAASCVVNVGSSTDSKNTYATVSEGCVCPVVVNKDNGLGDHTYGEEFKVTQVGSSLRVERTDCDVGWKMDLSFECNPVCNADEVNVDACFCENAGEGEHCTAGQFCNSDGTCFDEKLWRDDGRCGDNYPLPNGKPGQCDPTAKGGEKGLCCSEDGWCGNSDYHCKCTSCVSYAVCTPNAKNNATCICKSANGERKETCSYKHGCTKDGTCIKQCDDLLQSNCMCENPWEELIACTEEEICQNGICFRDPELCKIVSSESCGDVDVEKFCPIKCGNQHQPDDICSIADCNRLDSKEFCPIQCAPDCPVSSELVPLVEDCVCRSTNPTNQANQAEPCRKGKTCHEEKGCEVTNCNTGIFLFPLLFG